MKPSQLICIKHESVTSKNTKQCWERNPAKLLKIQVFGSQTKKLNWNWKLTKANLKLIWLEKFKIIYEKKKYIYFFKTKQYYKIYCIISFSSVTKTDIWSKIQ